MRNCEAVQKLTKPIIFILIGFLLLLTSCKNDDKKLKTPINLQITSDEYLLWDEVPNATSYTVYVKKNEKTKEYDSSINKLDVFEIMDEEGKYEFNVLAYDDNFKYLDSDYSLVLNYEIKSQLGNLEFKLTSKDYYELSIKNPTAIDGKLIIPSTYNGKKVDRNKQISFNQCDNMTSVIVPDTFTSSCLFMGCDKLYRVKLSNSNETLRKGTITDCESITEISFPKEVTTLQPEAIYNCKSLKKVYIGPNLTQIGNRNFTFCDNLDSILIDNDNAMYKSVDNCILTNSDNKIIYGNKNSKIPSISNDIGDYAFRGCELEELIIPSHIKTIGYSAFSACDKLKKVIIEEGIKEIGNAFINCDSLEEITLPNSLKTIGKNFFSGLKSLKKIYISDDNDNFLIEDNCFIQKDNNKLLFAMPNAVIPDYIISIGFEAFSLTDLKEIIMPDSIIELDECAFRNSEIEKVVFGSNLKKISASAFEYCSNLREVIFNDALEEIGSYAFGNCYQLESASLPATLKVVGDGSFYNCISSMVLHKTIEKVGEYAFKYCTLYTDFEPDELREFELKNRPFPDNPFEYHGFSGCSIVYCCDLQDDYVYSYTFYHYFETIGNESFSHSSINIMELGELLLVIPHRDGYEFVGFSTVEYSNNVEYEPIMVENEFEVSNNQSLIMYKKSYYISFDYSFISNIEYNKVLYSVWKKVD